MDQRAGGGFADRREETLPTKCYKIMMPAPFMLSLRRTRLCNAIKNRHKFSCSHLPNCSIPVLFSSPRDLLLKRAEKKSGGTIQDKKKSRLIKLNKVIARFLFEVFCQCDCPHRQQLRVLISALERSRKCFCFLAKNSPSRQERFSLLSSVMSVYGIDLMQRW